MSNVLDPDYWNARYRGEQTGWDLGAANPALVDAVCERADPTDRILIPGAGRAHEAIELWRRGYRDTFVLDWAAEAIAAVRSQPAVADAGLSAAELDERLVHADFFAHEGRYDFLLEQTFFCALDPGLRRDYVAQAAALLQPAGTWLGVLFDREFPAPGPPFGGSAEAYRRLFSTHFRVERLEPNVKAVGPRNGHEVIGVMHPI